MSPVNRLCFICCLLLSAYTGKAQDADYYLQGTIGNYPIAMRISCFDDSSCDTRYYYKKVLKDIVLDGTKKGNHVVLSTSKYNETAVRETFDLQLQADQSFTGTWISGSKKLPVKLSPIEVATIKNPYRSVKEVSDEEDSDPYSYLRSSLLSFVRDSVSKYKNKELVWFHEKGSGVSFFRLGNGFSPVQLQKINPILDTLHIENAMNELSCSGPWGGGIEFTIDVKYLDNNLIGFYVFASWSCGGAHPDFGGSGYLLELHTGRRFDIDDILAFDASATTEEQSGFDKYSAYHNDFFAPGLTALMIKEHGFEAAKTDEDCDYTDPEIWKYPSWQFTETGIEFTPFFARAMRACEDPYPLPFSLLKQYKNPGFRMRFRAQHQSNNANSRYCKAIPAVPFFTHIYLKERYLYKL